MFNIFIRCKLSWILALNAACITLVFGSYLHGQENNASTTGNVSKVTRRLFDGKSLSGWKGDLTFWRVEDGKIVAESTNKNPCKSNTFLTWEDGELDNFTFTLKFKITGDQTANSGIQLRSVVNPDGHVKGYQADIDQGMKNLGGLYDELGRGQLALRGEVQTIRPDGKRYAAEPNDIPQAYKEIKPASQEELAGCFKKDQWNEYSITAVENVIIIRLNGLVTCMVIDQDEKNRDLSGVLSLQLHSGPPMKIEFKDLELERLPLLNRKKVVLVAGRPSHSALQHEHNAGCRLLAKALNESGLAVHAVTYHNGWPRDPSSYDNANSIVFYCDGGGGHYVNQHLPEVEKLMKKGVGLVCIHYGIEVPKGESGDHYLNWIGGYFETFYSVNPHWVADFEKFPEHPITRGVKPFSIKDEWYYHMRFRDKMEGVTPILSALPPRETLNRPDGAHSGNPYVREDVLEKKLPQHVAWAYQRPEGGRGFGFSGAHFHKNWQNDNFRTVVLNALVWSTQLEVPQAGVKSKTPTDEEMNANLDPKAKPAPPVNKPATPPPEATKSSSTEKKSNNNSDAKSMEDSLKTLSVYPGLEIKPFAHEPMIANPINMDIDHLGRIWICEGVNYRTHINKDIPPRTEGDRIVVLEDTNHDGLADKSTVFFQDKLVDSAHGICVLGNRIIVSTSDKIISFYDDNNDLKADRHVVMFTGLKGLVHDHGIHAVCFGPDGKLYFNFGNETKFLANEKGEKLKDLAGNEIVDNRKPYQEGMAFRCNPDGTELETIAWNLRNPWEICADSFGTLWQSDNDDDGNRGTRINYIMPYGNYGYKDELTGNSWKVHRTNLEKEIPLQHWHLNDPGVMPNVVQTGAGSPTGICIYEGNLLPEVFRNQILHTDSGTNVVRCYPVKQQGAGYLGEIVNLVESKTDRWFRPDDVCVAPDGSVFIADWYDPTVGGHRMGDNTNGRVYRIAPAGHVYKPEAPDFKTKEGLAKALISPNNATRSLALMKLEELPFNDALEAVKPLFNHDNPRFVARALFVVGKHKTENGEDYNQKLNYIKLALEQDRHPDITIAAIRLIRQCKQDIYLDDIQDSVPVNHQSAAVRREILIAMRGLEFPEYSIIWTQLAIMHNSGDRWYLEALGIAADGHWDQCLSTYLAVATNTLDKDQVRDIVFRSRAKTSGEILLKIIESEKMEVDELPRYFRALDYQQIDKARLAEVAFTRNFKEDLQNIVVTETIKRLGENPLEFIKPYQNQIDQLLEKKQGTLMFVQLVNTLGLEKYYPAVMEYIASNYDQQNGIDAARLLIQKDQLKLIEKSLFTLPDEKAVKLGYAFTMTDEPRMLGIFNRIVDEQSFSTERRKMGVKGMSRTKKGLDILIKMTEKKEGTQGLEPALASAFSIAPYPDIRKAGEKFFPASTSKDAKPLPPIKELLNRKGDPIVGRTVYFAQGTCFKCHVVGTMGKEVGPNLSEIGKKLSPAAMYEAILFPSAAISHNYESYTMQLDSGIVVNGLLVSESDTEIRIKNEEGIERTIKKEEVIQKKKLEVSIMPADLQKLMTEQELVDLVEYLSTLQKK